MICKIFNADDAGTCHLTYADKAVVSTGNTNAAESLAGQSLSGIGGDTYTLSSVSSFAVSMMTGVAFLASRIFLPLRTR